MFGRGRHRSNNSHKEGSPEAALGTLCMGVKFALSYCPRRGVPLAAHEDAVLVHVVQFVYEQTDASKYILYEFQPRRERRKVREAYE